MKCVYFIVGRSGMVICGHAAPYMYAGSTYCGKHIQSALEGKPSGEIPERYNPSATKKEARGASQEARMASTSRPTGMYDLF